MKPWRKSRNPPSLRELHHSYWRPRRGQERPRHRRKQALSGASQDAFFRALRMRGAVLKTRRCPPAARRIAQCVCAATQRHAHRLPPVRRSEPSPGEFCDPATLSHNCRRPSNVGRDACCRARRIDRAEISASGARTSLKVATMCRRTTSARSVMAAERRIANRSRPRRDALHCYESETAPKGRRLYAWTNCAALRFFFSPLLTAGSLCLVFLQRLLGHSVVLMLESNSPRGAVLRIAGSPARTGTSSIRVL